MARPTHRVIEALRDKRLCVLALLAAGLAGCSTVADGADQTLRISSDPIGADCDLLREGRPIARVTTPAQVIVQKTKHDIIVRCSKAGYETAEVLNESDVAGATFGNIIIGGGIGWLIDSASGADNKYNANTMVTLNKL